MVETSGQERRTDLLVEMIGINSVNPLQTGPRSGSANEEAFATWLAARCVDLGATVTVDPVEPERPNVYAFFEGSSDVTVCIDVHLDTVGVEHCENDPFDAIVSEGRIHGRGSVDTKATLAVVLELLEQTRRDGRQIGPNLLLVGTVGEEIGGLTGAYQFQEWISKQDFSIQDLIVAEPTLCRPVHGHKGALGLEVTVHGKAAHSSKPELGHNAIVIASRIVAALEQEHERLVQGHALTAMGTGTLSVTEITGGSARNIVPDKCAFYAGRRIAPGEDPYAVYQDLSTLITEAGAPHQISIEMTYGRASQAFYTNPESSLIQDLAQLAETSPDLATYGSNALAYGDIASNIAVFGPGSIDQAHKSVEWIDIAQIDEAARIYRSWLLPGRAAQAKVPAF